MSPDDLIVHAYFDVNTEILWATVTLSLPGLLAQLQAIEGLGRKNSTRDSSG
jgi:uncharacterized protein with HEPN domain